MVKESFKNPENEFRGAPFWAWNTMLEKEELLRQVEDMKEHGLGGYFMHSRVGLETPYLQEEFLDLIEAVVKRSAENGMKAYLYDEDRWPSGFAGGAVPKAGKGDEFRNKYLSMQKKNGSPDESERGGGDGETSDGMEKTESGIPGKVTLLAEHTVTLNEKGMIGNAGDHKETYVFTERVCEPSRWFNLDTYSDNMNPECVKEFIKVTFERYKERVGDYFGDVIPAIFTDEPNVLSHHGAADKGVRILPWTTKLPGYFEKKFGYSLINKLPFLFFEGSESFKVRHDYWRTVSDLFVKAYTKQLGEWCGRNNIALTGHVLGEEGIANQIRVVGSVMPHYEYMQIPGIDILTESIQENLTVKQCSSVMHQFGRKRMLSELYGCSGWDFSFEGQKWVGDWQMVLGVNLRCQHLTWYTMKGSAKRDYPPCFNYQHPLWEHYPIIEDYFARLSYMLSQGTAKIDVLLIHPVRSGWGLMSDASGKEVLHLDSQLKKTMDILLNGHMDFDLGDETILERHGSVTPEGDLRVNKGKYKLVVVPYSYTLSIGTFDLLKSIADAGGRIIAVKRLPDMIDGEGSEELRDFWNRKEVAVVENNKKEIIFEIKKVLEPDVEIVNAEGRDLEQILYQERQIEDDTFVFIVNRDRTSGYSGFLKVKGSGGVEEWDLKSGDIKNGGGFQEGSYISIPFSIPPTGSKLYAVSGRIKLAPPVETKRAAKRYTQLADTWECRRKDPNGLPIDLCRYRIDEGEWSDEMMILKAHKEICRKLDIFRDVESRWIFTKDLKDPGNTVEIESWFEVADIPTNVFLAMEEAEGADVRINGKKIGGFTGWYMDRAVSKTDISGLLVEGRNMISISWEYRDGMQIEEFYIIGDFGVDLQRRLIKEPVSLRGGDYCSQGYPFYSGTMVYSQKITIEKETGSAYLLELNGYKGITALISVNSQHAGDMSWPPFSLDITELLMNGENIVEIEVVGSPRNLLGPNHLIEKYPEWTGPGQFVVEGDRFTGEYNIVPHGLNCGVRIQVVE